MAVAGYWIPCLSEASSSHRCRCRVPSPMGDRMWPNYSIIEGRGGDEPFSMAE